MTVSFFGHSNFLGDKSYEDKMLSIIEDSVGGGEVSFLLGNYGAFDNFAYECCKKYKYKHQSATLVFVTPYISEGYRSRLEHAAADYDAIAYPPIENRPYKFAIHYRNRYIVDNSDLVICYLTKHYGGAYEAVKYALGRGRKVINMAETKLPTKEPG